jgi:hypothetical protein
VAPQYDGEEKVVLPLHPFGRADVGEGILSVGSVADCELHVRVLKETYKKDGAYEFV